MMIAGTTKVMITKMIFPMGPRTSFLWIPPLASRTARSDLHRSGRCRAEPLTVSRKHALETFRVRPACECSLPPQTCVSRSAACGDGIAGAFVAASTGSLAVSPNLRADAYLPHERCWCREAYGGWKTAARGRLMRPGKCAPLRARLAAARRAYSRIQVVFNSVYFSRACSDLSRPLPLCL